MLWFATLACMTPTATTARKLLRGDHKLTGLFSNLFSCHVGAPTTKYRLSTTWTLSAMIAKKPSLQSASSWKTKLAFAKGALRKWKGYDKIVGLRESTTKTNMHFWLSRRLKNIYCRALLANKTYSQPCLKWMAFVFVVNVWIKPK